MINLTLNRAFQKISFVQNPETAPALKTGIKSFQLASIPPSVTK